MSQSKPSIVIVPGSFSLPEFYGAVTDGVASKGYEIKAIRLRSTEDLQQPATMYDDATAIAHEVAALVDQGKEVILVAHSYGGVPASESIKGLAKIEGSGKVGGVVNLAYLTALVPQLGASAADMLADIPAENRVELRPDEHGYMVMANHAASAALCFSDLPAEEGEVWMKRSPRHSAASFIGPLTYAGYKDVPVSYLLCAEDKVIPPGVQQKQIEIIEREAGREVDVTVIQTGHIPTASAPEKVIDWITGLATRYENGKTIKGFPGVGKDTE
ncbi:Alpha/beta hydrolase fold-1 [Aspergillus pseudocaelatus]|uniref:Alpha/beta hydrolase fold-1 n=1 Tax=Aspergillus pseudocaelatus TaxID=1825620 RepID=A0ABQ6X4K8_9EURO|nr:Alpha/beta hydrolase fold-1 [Aspergillus pseudocaelatus]